MTTLPPIKTFINPLFIPVTIIVVVFSVISFILSGSTTLALSAVVGSGFSYMGFHHLVETQKLLLSKQQKSLVFIRFLARFVIYATGIILAIKYPQYLRMWTIMVFLFTFQVSYIMIEFIKNYIGYKKRLKDG